MDFRLILYLPTTKQISYFIKIIETFVVQDILVWMLLFYSLNKYLDKIKINCEFL